MKQLLSITDLTDLFGVTRQTVHNWIKAGLPCIRFRGTIRFKIEKVEEFFGTEIEELEELL